MLSASEAGRVMARGKHKKRAAEVARDKRETAVVSQVAAVDQTVADNSAVVLDRSSGPRWPLWLVKKTPQQDIVEGTHSAAPDAVAIGDVKASPLGRAPADRPVGVPESYTINEELALSSGDENKNAHPSVPGVVNLATDMKKENQMQTAKQITPAPQAETVEKIDLRDRLPVKGNTSEKVLKAAPDGMASLFGPVIEDDVKGVRSQIREMIQSELQGELGQRFSRNLRIVIRREIAAAVDDQFDRL